MRILAVYFSKKDGASSIHQLLYISIFICLGLGIAAVQILPTMELSRYSIRSIPMLFDTATSFSLQKINLLSFLLPHIVGSAQDVVWFNKTGNFWELTGYSGVIPLILASSLFFFRKNNYIVIFWSMLFFFLILSLGKYGFLYGMFYNTFPIFTQLRIPATFLYIVVYSLALLSGFGLQKISQMAKSNNEKKNIIRYLICLGVLFVLEFYFYHFNEYTRKGIETYLSDKLVISDISFFHNLLVRDSLFFCITVGVMFGAVILRNAGRVSAHSLKIVFIALLLVDLALFDLPLIQTKPIPVDPPKVVSKLQNTIHSYRTLDLSGNYNLGQYNIEQITGYNPLYLRYYQDFLWQTGDHLLESHEPFIILHNIKNLNFLKLLNTKYIISSSKLSETDALKNIYSDKTGFVYELLDTLPRAYIVPQYKVIPDQNKIFQTIASREFDPKNFVIFEKESLTTHAGGTYEPIHDIRYDGSSISLRVKRSYPGFLVLSEIWYPGWRAFINSKEVEIYRANAVFRSVYVPAGENDISFVYNPPLFTLGMLISLISILICGGLIVRRGIGRLRK